MRQLPLLGTFVAHTVYVPASKPFVRAGLDRAFSPDRAARPAYADAYAALLMKPQQLLNWASDQNHVLLEKFLIPNYKNLKTPLVIVNGEQDANLPVAFARRFHRVVLGSRLLVVPNTGHELHFNHPEVIFAVLDSLHVRESN